MPRTLDVVTRDGTCRTTITTPKEGQGPWPVVLFFVDGAGPRAAPSSMAERIAQEGYAVVTPDLFYRVGSVFDLLPPGTPHDAKAFVTAFGSDPEFRAKWRSTFFASATDPEHLKVDVAALLEALGKEPGLAPGPVATTGYCMGGQVSLRVATLFGDRVAAAASFHGGFLATTQPDSPHLGIAHLKARYYAACAVEDPSCPDDMKARLEDALTRAGVEHTVETYEGARHGFAITDSPTYDPAAAERHYRALFALLAKTFARKA